MSIDVNKITSVLAKLKDPQLQQYAQLHKNDPYIMALAMSESNRRKEVRAADQGNAQEQPKVVDQMVAEMAAVDPMGNVTGYAGGGYLPEDQGIGQLNAGNMNFADGGIVAFAGGGNVERYADLGFTGWSYGDWADAEAARRRQKVAAAEAAYDPTENLRKIAQTNARYTPFAVPKNAEEVAVLQRYPAPAVGPKTGAGETALTAGAGQKGSGTGSDTGSATGSTVGAGGAGGTSRGSGSLEARYKKLQPSDAEYAALDAKETGVANALKNLGKSGIDEFEAEEAKRGDVFKGREARLAEQEKNLAGRKDQNFGLALLQAGAAMMSTPGGLGVALGKGVSVGTERYAAGLDKLNAAQERLMDAKDRLEELRVNRDDLTSSERRRLKNQAKQYEVEAEKLFLDGAHKKLGYKRDDAKNLFAGITTLMGQETAAGATIEAAKIRSQDQKEYLAELRGGAMVETARKNIMADITKANPYADEPTRQRLFQTEWAKALQSNPALAKYAGVASGGGGASSADPLGLR